jgi:hypothetical protein
MRSRSQYIYLAIEPADSGSKDYFVKFIMVFINFSYYFVKIVNFLGQI